MSQLNQTISKLNERIKYLEKEIISQLSTAEKSEIINTLPLLSKMEGSTKEALKSIADGEDNILAFEKQGLNIANYIPHEIRNFKSLATELNKKYRERDILKTILKAGDESDIEKIPQNVIADFVKLEEQQDSRTDIISRLEEYKKEQEEFTIKKEQGGKYIGIATGFDLIDKKTEGIRSTHLFVVGGYTSSGKSYYAINVISNILRDKRVLFFSTEMTSNEIIGRILGIRLKENPNRLLKGLLDNDLYARQCKAQEELSKQDLEIMDTLTDVDEIKMSIMTNIYNKQTDLIVIDYLQNLTSDKKLTEYELMTKASRDFQLLAQKIKVPIMLISQISNEGAKSKSDLMSFKGSGGIAASAHVAIELKRVETIQEIENKVKTGGKLEIMASIKKNRQGQIGCLPLSFDTRTGILKCKKFSDDYQKADKTIKVNKLPY